MEEFKKFKQEINDRFFGIENRMSQISVIKLHNDHENSIATLIRQFDRIKKEQVDFLKHILELQKNSDQQIEKMKNLEKRIHSLVNKKFKKLEEKIGPLEKLLEYISKDVLDNSIAKKEDCSNQHIKTFKCSIDINRSNNEFLMNKYNRIERAISDLELSWKMFSDSNNITSTRIFHLEQFITKLRKEQEDIVSNSSIDKIGKKEV